MDFNKVIRLKKRRPRTRAKIYKYTSKNVYYDKVTRCLFIYNGLRTSPVIKKTFLGSYMFSLTTSGSIYITLPAINFRSR
jgi:hypothetical protein